MKQLHALSHNHLSDKERSEKKFLDHLNTRIIERSCTAHMTFFEKQQIITDLFNEFWIVCDDELRFASRLHRFHGFSYI